MNQSLSTIFALSHLDFIRQCEHIQSRMKQDEIKEKILFEIIDRIESQKNIQSRYVLQTLFESYFTDDMKHLQLIEQTFGRQSLKLLAVIPNDPQAEKDFLHYLQTQDSALKTKLIKKYLHTTGDTPSNE